MSFPSAPEPPRNESLKVKAADLLRVLLGSGPQPSTRLREEIEAAGLSWHAANKAKERLGIVSIRRDGSWLFWRCPFPLPSHLLIESPEKSYRVGGIAHYPAQLDTPARLV